MYQTILIEAGYQKYRPEYSGIQCWIKPGSPDINVDSSTGLWASADAIVPFECGMNAESLKSFLNNT